MRESGEGRGVLTAARLVETPRVAELRATAAEVGTSREDLFESVRVEPQEQSSIVTITAEADSAAACGGHRERVRDRCHRRADANLPARAAPARSGGCRAVSTRFRRGRATRARDARSPTGSATLRGLVGARDPTLQIASLAVPPAEPSWPRPLLSLAVAVFAGLLLGVGVAIALELVNPLVLRDEDVLEERTPLLARVPRVSTRDLAATPPGARPRSAPT